jgi:hypothetical protein
MAAVVSMLFAGAVVVSAPFAQAASRGPVLGSARYAAPSGIQALAQHRVGADGKSAYRLAAHNAAVRYDRDARMWDCWDRGVRPRLSAWNGRRWVLWSRGAVSRDQRK